jgi:hypothetical protein
MLYGMRLRKSNGRAGSEKRKPGNGNQNAGCRSETLETHDRKLEYGYYNSKRGN